MVDRISSLDLSYKTGDLSLFPEAKDTRSELYEVKNNAETFLTHSLSYAGQFLLVDDTSSFPDKGLILVGTEIVYYDEKTSVMFKTLKRGFAGSRQNQWSVNTRVANAVLAEPHNVIKDAVINIETNLGLEENPDPDSLNGILKSLEERYLSPKPIFRASAVSGSSPLEVRFQNFSYGNPIRYLWDFGDGTQSVEDSPTHTYLSEGTYTVKLNMITSLGAQGVATKENYINVDDTLKQGYYYVSQYSGTTSTSFQFIDQTPGNVTSRYWIFGDGQIESESDPDIHVVDHTYSDEGEYETALLVVMDTGKLIRYVTDKIVVS